ncbi:general stress protein 13 [Gracilibacillus oryzae]|uniref:General stress protein 13 n=1 Tax=Gracilibacillus oryzae TaxID=1672701 RepID=A0A7C8L2Z0_9BACI|nr:S1 domain-containing post-transcriptional regulator GSP13 [Gracilibacillus oryzae]KAB8131822.1 general stress protein 13 [Gracilibacillus oryzae]
MSKEFEVGDTVNGVVTGIQPYGAFIELSDNVQGLVHISEITNGYVKDIQEHIKEGDKVKVKILEIDKTNNKYALSLRALQEEEESITKNEENTIHDKEGEHGFNTLKDKLKEWIKQSE